MPYKDPERKKEWERLHRPQRLERRRELRLTQAADQVTRPRMTRKASGGVGFLVPHIAGGCRCLQPKDRNGCWRFNTCCRYNLEKELGLVARRVRHVVYRTAFLFHE